MRLTNIPPVAITAATVLLGAVLAHGPRGGPPDLEGAARAGLVRVHEFRGYLGRGVVYARGGAPVLRVIQVN